MIDQTVPVRFLATCTFCAAQIDTRDPHHYQRMRGWSHNRNKNNSPTLAEKLPRWACGECIRKLQKGISIGQLSLLGLENDDA